MSSLNWERRKLRPGQFERVDRAESGDVSALLRVALGARVPRKRLTKAELRALAELAVTAKAAHTS